MHIHLSDTFAHTIRKCRHRHHELVLRPEKVRRILPVSLPPPRYPKMQTPGATQELLSVFNQCSPRGYICVVLCFPCDDSRRGDAILHIQQSLIRLAKERPLFAGRLYVTCDGRVVMRRSRAYDIPFTAIHSEPGKEVNYEQLTREEFPPGFFVRPRYGVGGLVESNQNAIPMSKVEVAFARGGLFLSIYLQHSITDGGSLRVFLASFGNQTRNVSANKLPSEQKLRVSSPGLQNVVSRKPSETVPFKKLIASCPEYTILPDLSGPTQPVMKNAGIPIHDVAKIGRIFVFTTERLLKLRKLIKTMNNSPDLPTAYMSLAALTFAHVTKARIAFEPAITGIEPSQTAALWNSVNWRTRAFPGTTDNYFGNAVLPAVTRVPREQVNAACYQDEELARLATLVRQSVNVVNEEYVSRRMAMMSQAPDPRIVGINYDPRSPEALAFNTWRHFGADAEWYIPGVPVSKPDVIRRAVGGWGLGTALILPAKANSDRQELFVSLTVDAMDALCQDERWMRWVDKVVG
ncbi:hypothetical protein F4861DRAFT_381809 [Xylaria intraflava]|nr:hypothetical protein F4861DRAFT_381809 [Xylaria intraflava]